jgi:hypothetical protein
MEKRAKYFHDRDPFGSVFGPMLSRTFPISYEPLPDSMEKLLRLLPDDRVEPNAPSQCGCNSSLSMADAASVGRANGRDL